MAKKWNESMFEKCKEAFKKSDRTGSSAFTNIMKFPAGNTYTIRLIPNVDNIDDTFFHHYVNQWTSKKDGSFVSALSLKTFGERDPITEARWKLYREWKDTNPSKDEKFENPIKEKEQWFINIYVIDDPANPENNGKVKILSMGPQLKAIVDDAMNGDGADEFGAAIFDLTKDGCDFKIKAEEKGVFTSYEKSRFSTKTSLDLSEEEIDDIYSRMHDLKQIHVVKTTEELQKLLDEHFWCGEGSSEHEERKPLKKTETKAPVQKKPAPKKAPVEDDDDEIPMEFGSDDKEITPDELLNELDLD